MARCSLSPCAVGGGFIITQKTVVNNGISNRGVMDTIRPRHPVRRGAFLIVHPALLL